MQTYSIPSHIKDFIKALGYEITIEPMLTEIKNWQAYYKADGDFWNKTEIVGDVTYKTKRRSVHPAQRVCREWASLMLNEDTVINCEDETCNDWIDGYFNRIKFWSRGQDLIERTFALGTGCWALWLDFLTGKLQVRRYDADMILILSWDDDEVSEIALCTQVNRARTVYDQVQLHLHAPDGYHIITRLFEHNTGRVVALDGVIDDLPTYSHDPWFAVITPAIGNTCVDLSPYGMSIYANAKDVLEAVDIAFDGLITEPQTGKMRLFLNDTLFQVVNNGSGRKVIPFGREDATAYRMVDSGEEDLIKEFAPALRTDALTSTYRTALQTLGDACGFGVGYFDIDKTGGIKTATEVSADNSQLMRNIRKHENLIGDAIEQVVRACLQAARRLGESLPDEGDITVTFDDSIIQDTESEKRLDLAEVGVTMNAWEYRRKWYGEDEEAAKANVPGAPTYDIDTFVE